MSKPYRSLKSSDLRMSLREVQCTCGQTIVHYCIALIPFLDYQNSPSSSGHRELPFLYVIGLRVSTHSTCRNQRLE